LFFPELTETKLIISDSASTPQLKLNQEDCRKMGREMTEWYYGGGGILLSQDALKAYFRLARALTLACYKSELKTPDFAKESDVKLIFPKNIDKYRSKLNFTKSRNNSRWVAWPRAGARDNDDIIEDNDDIIERRLELNEGGSGDKVGGEQTDAMRFEDFVFLNMLSSRLRSALVNDLRGRAPPDAQLRRGANLMRWRY